MKSTQVSKGRLARLLEFDDELNAMLLERCWPGTPLRPLAEDDQDVSGSGSSRALLQEPRHDWTNDNLVSLARASAS